MGSCRDDTGRTTRIGPNHPGGFAAGLGKPAGGGALPALRVRPAGAHGAALPRVRLPVRVARPARPAAGAAPVPVRAPPEPQPLVFPPHDHRDPAAAPVLEVPAPDAAAGAAANGDLRSDGPFADGFGPRKPPR